MSFGIVPIFFWFALFSTLGEAFIRLRDAEQEHLGFGISQLMGCMGHPPLSGASEPDRLVIPRWHGFVPVIPGSPAQERVALQAVPPLAG